MEADTIAAVVTPPGMGGVGIVRVSGPLSRTLPSHLFPLLDSRWESHRLRHGRVVDFGTGEMLDQALGCLMSGPHSYTGEDVFEIHCHGSPLVLERVLGACLAAGCRPARAGEFTLRAFLNQRLDLTQAEAVMDVVRARSNAGLEMAAHQLAGWLGERISPYYNDLLGIAAHMEAMVDFVEEDIPLRPEQLTVQRLASIRKGIGELLDGARQGMILREGAALCIAGSPNVGKSSIMNELLGAQRSIVTAVPGTTRDTVEESIQLRDLPFRVVDTAGIRATTDPVEQIGVDRSRRVMAMADMILLVIDRSRIISAADTLVVDELCKLTAGKPDARVVVALNKADLPAGGDHRPLLKRLRPDRVVESSAVAPGGLGDLRQALEEVALGGERHDVVAPNVRHQDALRRTWDALGQADSALRSGVPLDLVSLDVRAAAAALGEITGATVDEEILNRIFSEFCIGK
ncbi:MAG: tRNA uridine-5-carboxymethylaminomethyl(34) synthesis GTPase MnmE [Chloroflexota bacterium]